MAKVNLAMKYMANCTLGPKVQPTPVHLSLVALSAGVTHAGRSERNATGTG
jgi:hypothetical protein